MIAPLPSFCLGCRTLFGCLLCAAGTLAVGREGPGSSAGAAAAAAAALVVRTVGPAGLLVMTTACCLSTAHWIRYGIYGW
jgi:hypothetical protein